MDDLFRWLQQQIENQRHRGDALKAMSAALPPDAGAYLTETADMLLADVDAKRRILDLHTGEHECSVYTWQQGVPDVDHFHYVLEGERCSTVRLLAASFAAQPGYREEWRPEVTDGQ